MTKTNIHLADFLLEKQAEKPLICLLLAIADICTNIAEMTAKGALANITEKLQSQNIQGETQTQLDVITNDLMIEGLSKCEVVAGLVSEEMDDVINIRAAQYLVEIGRAHV